MGQIIGGDFAKFCGLLRIYEVYTNHARSSSDIMGPNRHIHTGITDKTSFLPEIRIKRILIFVTFIS